MKVLSSFGKWEVRIGDDDKLYCTCPGWRFHAKRWCKHLEQWSQTNYPAVNQQVRDNLVSTLRVGGHTGTIRQVDDSVEATTQRVIAELKEAGYGR